VLILTLSYAQSTGAVPNDRLRLYTSCMGRVHSA
jgi:hypothetical protein